MSDIPDDLPSFPSKAQTGSENDSVIERNDWEEDEEDLNAAFNVSFLESLDDSTKFSYAGVCAETLFLLYGLKEK